MPNRDKLPVQRVLGFLPSQKAFLTFKKNILMNLLNFTYDSYIFGLTLVRSKYHVVYRDFLGISPSQSGPIYYNNIYNLVFGTLT